jgi:hypothetical protein
MIQIELSEISILFVPLQLHSPNFKLSLPKFQLRFAESQLLLSFPNWILEVSIDSGVNSSGFRIEDFGLDLEEKNFSHSHRRD